MHISSCIPPPEHQAPPDAPNRLLDAGYTFNISMLRKVFAPQFTMHDMRRTGEYELTSRWTMIMQFTLNRYSPLQRWWDPQLIFTGVSIMGVNKENGA